MPQNRLQLHKQYNFIPLTQNTPKTAYLKRRQRHDIPTGQNQRQQRKPINNKGVTD